jgi:hypothetical protein
MRLEDFRAWLVRFGDAWEAGDAGAISTLFAPGALFQVRPFEVARRGKPAIREHFHGLLAGQADVRFSAEVLGVGATYGVAHWRATYRPTSEAEPRRNGGDHPGAQQGGRQHAHSLPTAALDGVLLAAFDPVGRCTSLRQWWHEGDPAGG